MGNFETEKNCLADQQDLERVNPEAATFAVPNHILIAGQDYRTAEPLIQTAQRRGWQASLCRSFGELQDRVSLIPPGGVLLLNTSILSDRSGIERLTQLGHLPAPPRIYLTTAELDVNALAVREICIAAHIPVQDILVLPLAHETLDRLLGT